MAALVLFPGSFFFLNNVAFVVVVRLVVFFFLAFVALLLYEDANNSWFLFWTGLPGAIFSKFDRGDVLVFSSVEIDDKESLVGLVLAPSSVTAARTKVFVNELVFFILFIFFIFLSLPLPLPLLYFRCALRTEGDNNLFFCFFLEAEVVFCLIVLRRNGRGGGVSDAFFLLLTPRTGMGGGASYLSSFSSLSSASSSNNVLIFKRVERKGTAAEGGADGGADGGAYGGDGARPRCRRKGEASLDGATTRVPTILDPSLERTVES